MDSPTAQARHSDSQLDATPDPVLDLVGRAPDPIADAQILQALLDATDPATRRFCASLCHPDRSHRPLREHLPGLDLVEAPAFSDRLNVRAANSLGRVNASALSDLAGLAPAQIENLPLIGTATVELILAMVAGEWAAAYLGRRGKAETGSRFRREESSKRDGSRELAAAFETLERMPAFETFRQRRLEDNPPSARTLAAQLHISVQSIHQKTARMERVLISKMRDGDWPIRIAVDELSARLGAVARPQELDDVWTAIASDGSVPLAQLPHRLALLLRLGGYRVTDEWILDPDIEALTDTVLATLARGTSDDVDAVGRHLSRLGIREDLQLSWLASRHGFRIIDGSLVALPEL